MKMTKKLFLVAIATAAFALTSCDALLGMGAGGDTFEKGEKEKEQGTKKDLTIGYKNLGNSKLYKRVWEQLGNKETVQALQTTIAIDTTKVAGLASSDDKEIWVAGDGANARNTRAVVGLIFDLHQTKTKEFTVNDAGKTTSVTKKLYDFVLIGYRPATKGFYVEKYTDVPEDAFAEATNNSSFSDADGIGVEYLKSTTGVSTSAEKFYIGNDNAGNVVAADGVDTSLITERTGVLGKGEEEKVKARDTEVPLQEFTVYITQETPGTYNIKLLGLEFEYTPEVPEDATLAKKWYKNGYRIGGAGYYVNVPVDTEAYANFNSNNANTIGLEEEVDE